VDEKISFKDPNGKHLSGLFNVSGGMITVTAPEGRTTKAEIEESMLTPRPSPECSYFNCSRTQVHNRKYYHSHLGVFGLLAAAGIRSRTLRPRRRPLGPQRIPVP
jgi:hypothetical protein